MSVEKERSDTSIILNEEELSRSIESILLKKDKVGFEDVIAEPVSTHSLDSVWIGSHAAFELIRFFSYRLLTAFLAVPVAFIIGLLHAVFSCLHIWLVMPTIQSFMILLPSVQKVWKSLTDMFITALFHSIGKFLSSIQNQTTKN